MTSPIPTIQVLLDDGSGTYPTDATARVQLGAGVSVSGHGRTDEFTAASAATFSCTLRNDDGGLSAGAGFGLGPFGVGGFGSGTALPVYPGQGIRYKETKGSTTTTVFTGVVSGIDLGWGGGTAKASTVTLTAVDGLAALARKKLRSMLEQEYLLRSPSAYYTLGEDTGSTSAGDTSGNTAAPMTIAGTGAALTFGTGTGPGTDGLTATQFFGGQFLVSKFTPPTTYTALCFLNTSVTPSSNATIFLSPREWLSVNTSGHVELRTGPLGLGATGATSATVNDGRTHLVGLSVQSGVGYQIFLDGTVTTIASATAGTNGVFIAPVSTFAVGGGRTTIFSDTITGTISHVGVFPSVLTSSVTAAISAVSTGLTETTQARFARLASYVGVSTATTTGMSGQLMAAQSTSGASGFDALQACADAEGGVFYCRGDGVMVLQGRGYRAQKTTPTLTVALKDIPASSMVITQDTQQILNSMTVTRTGGAAQLVTNTSSISSYGLYEQSLDLAVVDDQSALSRGQWLTNAYDAPTQRLGSMSVNLLTSSSAEQIFTVDVGDRWALSGMPSQTWTGFGDLSVEGWSRTLTVTESGAEWSMTMNLLPWVLFQSGIYDDAGSLYDTAVYA